MTIYPCTNLHIILHIMYCLSTVSKMCILLLASWVASILLWPYWCLRYPLSASWCTEKLLGCFRGKTHLKVFMLRDGVVPSSGTCCCKYWFRSPYLMYSTMTHGGSSNVHMPSTRTMFGSLRRAMILTSLWKSILKYTEATITVKIQYLKLH